MTKRLVIIDGKSVFYRGYYAMPTLATRDGTPTGGVYGFAVMALEIVKKLQPDYVCVAWDKSKTNIRLRREMYPEYKANRKPAPPDFYEQIPVLQDLLAALEWPLYELDDYEADDIMGAFAKQAGAEGIESYLVTSDLDVLQLVNPHTHIYTLKKGLSHIELFNVASFEEKYGVGAHQWVDVKALKGDSSDNIPGVAGVGEKTALELIKKYETLDGVYEHLEELKPALRAKLEKDKDMAYLSKKLVTLIVDAPIKIDLAKSTLQSGVTPEFVALLRKLEFRNLLRQVESQIPKDELARAEISGEKIVPAKIVELNSLSFTAGKPRVVTMNPAGTAMWVSDIAGQAAIIAIGEASPFGAQQQSLLGEVTKEEGAPYAQQTPEIVATLANGPIIGHHLKPLLRALLAEGITWPGKIGHDTKLGAFLLDSLQRSRELSDLLEQPIDANDPAVVVSAVWQVYEDQKAQFDQLPELSNVARDIDFPSIQLLALVEHRGILLDVPYLREMSAKFAQRIGEFEKAIYEQAGQEFNISSPAQLGNILFDTLGLPTQGVKKGKTGYSTGANELAKLRGLNPIVDLISQYREYTKLQSTYIEALPRFVDSNSRIHTTFALDVAATGRLSSHDPNLQNIPTRTDIGQAIRAAFMPAEGKVFISADYSQFELRLAAVMAKDQELIGFFNEGIDIHTATAAEVYGVPLEKVDKTMRRNAKVVNFGILYGMSPHGLSIATGMTPGEAKEFIQKYFELRKPIRDYMDKTVEKALVDGYVQTIFGRRRPTPDLKSSNFIVREAAKRMAINMPIQGTEADLMKLAMLRVEENLQGLGEQILQVHDSILVEAPKDNVEKVTIILKDIMENIYTLPVKLEVEVTVGGNWGEV
jgi:DNA polymerase-1